MKKFFALSIFLVMVFSSLCACSLDFSGEISDKMDDLYNEIYDKAEPFLKEDEIYSSGGNASLPESKPTAPDSGSTGNGSVGDGTGNEGVGGNDTPSENIPYGTSVGMRLPNANLHIFDENGLSTEVLGTTSLSGVTVINFWGTWCHFCCEELPYFDDIAAAYKGRVNVLAIHSVDCFNISAPKYVAENFPESEIIFLKDENTTGRFDDTYTLYDGRGSYPYTIIIDENGIITYTGFNALDYGELKALVDHALNK